MKMMLTNVRAAFPAYFKATKVKPTDKAKFGGSFLLDPETRGKLLKTIEKNIAAVAKEKWGAKADKMLKQMQASDKLCLHDGDLKDDKYEGYAGMMYVSTSSDVRPTVINRDKTPLTEEDGVIYSGCYVNASIELWAQDNSWGKRINAQIRGVQFVKDGDSFGGASAASSDEFEELEPTEDDGGGDSGWDEDDEDLAG